MLLMIMKLVCVGEPSGCFVQKQAAYYLVTRCLSVVLKLDTDCILDESSLPLDKAEYRIHGDQLLLEACKI